MSRYHNPAAKAQGQQPATDRRTKEQLVECCVADAGLQSNLRQAVDDDDVSTVMMSCET